MTKVVVRFLKQKTTWVGGIILASVAGASLSDIAAYIDGVTKAMGSAAALYLILYDEDKGKGDGSSKEDTKVT
jgi:hypothetical protein